MTLINWDNRLALNFAEIDSQHQKLVAMINDLNAAMLEGKGKEAIALLDRAQHELRLLVHAPIVALRVLHRG